MTKDYPPHLYKFRDWSNKYHQIILRNNAIWFASPNTFNDPFDCKIPIRYDELSDDEFRERMIYLAKSENPNTAEGEIIKEVNEICANSSFRNKRNFQKTSDKFVKGFAEAHGIFSLAGNHTSNLMWSHYANSHTGICIEFDTKKLKMFLLSLFTSDKEVITGHKVEYSNKYPVIIPNSPDDDEIYWEILTSKSIEWKYEEEYRFIYSQKSNLARGIPKDTITSVILGCDISNEHRKEIIDLVKYQFPRTKLIQAKMTIDKYVLEFSEIN